VPKRDPGAVTAIAHSCAFLCGGSLHRGSSNAFDGPQWRPRRASYLEASTSSGSSHSCDSDDTVQFSS